MATETERTRLLVKYGFVKDGHKALYNQKLEEGQLDSWVKGLSEKELNEMADEEERELHLDNTTRTGLPKTALFERIIYEEVNQYIENAYYFIISELKHDWSFDKMYKIADIFAASPGSSFFGVSEQRLGMQQDKASQYLKGISEMVKALFQLVRELRIIDERLGFYKHTFERDEKKDPKQAVGSEITLKGIWIDQVEGGVKNAASVYGLAQTVGFTILPDLFFRVRANDIGMHKTLDNMAEYDTRIQKVLDDIDAKSDALAKEGFNEKVLEVLKRKLAQYYMWKMRTYKELAVRRSFTIKYLRQHYDTIKLYMGWIKPYLRNIKRLQLNQTKMDSADLITAFEGAMIEIEVLATGKKMNDYCYPCVLVRFDYRTRPALTYMQEGYQRGPAHTGEFDMMLRGYVWTKEQIENYRTMKDEEDLQLLGSINESINEALEALGEKLKEYLKEGGEEFEKKEEEKKKTKRPSGAEPFTALFSGFKEILEPLIKLPGLKIGSKGEDWIKKAEGKENAERRLKTVLYQSFKNYKKAHGLMSL